jgi:hypothetical protein
MLYRKTMPVVKM